ncbi:hypothetical protein ANN_22478 [Periplaneta americana]|uniref:Reverse transcriptase domain-containing protein n=1 Tax=Periplaneta americana TaxID=6978 RepID=A0ABQ8S923_PERAM|nr:hypothetical protein ANN_22478 [Periplaneta americana]
MLQLNTQEKSLYIKVISPTIYEKLIHKHEGTTVFKYNNGEQTQVKISKADVPSVTVRAFNLPPEVPSSLVQTSLNTYGVVHSVRQEQWSTAYPFPVNNGVCAVKMEIKKHIPGSIAIAGYNAHITYVGQPILCYVCHEPNHKKEDCSQRKTTFNVNVKPRQLLLSDIVSGTVVQQREEQTTEHPTERDAPVEEETDTASETETTKTVTTEDEQNIMDTTEYTANDAADLAQDREQLAVIADDVEITNISYGIKTPLHLGESTLDLEENKIGQPTETSSKKLKPMAQNEFTRDPRLRSREDGRRLAAVPAKRIHQPRIIRAEANRETLNFYYQLLNELYVAQQADGVKIVRERQQVLYSASPTSATKTDTLLKHVNRHLNLQQQHDLQLPITEEEILMAIETAPKNSAPGPDGLTYQLYKIQWNLIKDTLVDLFNYIFDRGIVVEGFSDGIVILLPKVINPRTVSEYRPITLLNTDYKLFMKILACRVKTTFRDIIEIDQTCSVPDKSIIHNLATIRDSILYYEESPDEKAALLSIDFNKAFDRMNHLYLQRVMKHFCIPETFVNAISSLYDSAYSKIQVNGFFKKRIPIASSLRQGCPLSMCLFSIGIEPLIRMSHNILQSGRATCNMFTIRAYADDVVILLRDEDECTKVPQILQTYSMASCAQINVQKSSLVPLGNWPVTHTVNHIPIKRKAKILGLIVCASFKEMVDINWSITSARTRATMFQHIHRNLNLLERIWHINVFCLSKYSTVLDRGISFYVWKAYFYKLPKTQLHLPITKGGLQLTATKEKSQALLTRNILRAKHDESDPMDNKFRQNHIPLLCSKTTTLPHSLKMIWEIIESYPPTTVTNEKNQNTKIIYTYLMKKAVQTPGIVEKLPNQRWGNIWRNLHMANIPTARKTTVYCYLNHIIPTEEKRHRHNLTDSPACKKCGWLDTLKHRVTNCGAAKTIWEGAKALLVKVWPDSQLHDWFQTLLVLDPPTKQICNCMACFRIPALSVDKVLAQNGRILTYSMLKEEAAKLETKDDKSSQILKELKLLQLNSSLNLV